MQASTGRKLEISLMVSSVTRKYRNQTVTTTGQYEVLTDSRKVEALSM